MPRRVVYGLGIWANAIATVLTIVSIVLPRWIRWESDIGKDLKFSYGLHKKCSTVTGTCEPFPADADCQASGPAGGVGGETFCALWRSVGFAMSFAVIIELATWVAFAVVLLGGVQQRNRGWKVVCVLLAITTVVQAAGMSVVAYLYDHDERFFPPGWKLDVSWILCTFSWSLLALTGMGIGAATYASPNEGGYELIPDS